MPDNLAILRVALADLRPRIRRNMDAGIRDDALAILSDIVLALAELQTQPDPKPRGKLSIGASAYSRPLPIGAPSNG